jgi:hypothetical protein
MAKQPKVAPLDTGAEVVEDLHEVVEAENENVSYVDVTGQDDLPEGVTDLDEKEDEKEEEQPASAKTRKQAAKPKANADDDVPAELKGKSPAELARMYREAQQVIGRQGDELGKLREAADVYIRANLKSRAEPQKKVEEVKAPDDVDFFTDPKKAMEIAIANHPSIRELTGKAKEIATAQILAHRETMQEKFNAMHPDATEIVQNPNFKTWIAASPIRKAMIVRANDHYDLTAANELFSTWKELESLRAAKPAAEPTKQTPKTVTKPVAGREAARVPTGGNASPRDAKQVDGKIYRRADVIRLKIEDPDRYDAMADELTKAYAEGRVR